MCTGCAAGSPFAGRGFLIFCRRSIGRTPGAPAEVPIPVRNLVRWLVVAIYPATLLRFTLFKKGFGVSALTWSGYGSLMAWRLRYSTNFVPFRTISYYLAGNVSSGIAATNLLGNILLFIPLGFLLPLVLPRVQSMKTVTAIGFGASVVLEVLQLITGLGSLDVDDVLLNGLGVALGALGYTLLPHVGSAVRRIRN